MADYPQEPLSEEKKALIPQYVAKWESILRCTSPADRERAEAGARKAYADANIEFPDQIIWCDSVKAAHEKAKELCEGTSVSPLWGQWDAGWLCLYDFYANEYDVDECHLLKGQIEVAQSASWWFALDGAVVFSERPTVFEVDEEWRPHCETGPCYAWPDGFRMYCWHGVTVPELVVERPEEITVEMIDAEDNAEVRRVMLERFGVERFMREGNATLLDDDPKWGKLWRKEVPGDEPICMVEVLNSTPEPDGSIKTYLLRVPPDTSKTLDGLAWMAWQTAEEYEQVAIET